MDEKQPYATHEGQIGVRVTFLISTVTEIRGVSISPDKRSINVCTYEALKKRATRTPGLRLREGKGQGNEALFSFENMPIDWQRKCIESFGDPKRVIKETAFLETFYQIDYKASDFYSTYKLPSGKGLDKSLIQTYTINASILNAVQLAMTKRRSFRKAYGNPNSTDARPIWEVICDEVEVLADKLGHSLRIPSLRRILSEYKKNGYQSLISGKLENQNTAKVVSEQQLAVLEKLLRRHSNFDNVQISRVYNEVAEKLGWKSISDATVAKYRKDLDLYVVAGNRGTSVLRNSRNMQVKRKATNVPMVYWTIDGWDVELLYQNTTINDKNNKVTTYHNRPTCVMVLDPYLKYPVGYAIGTHETPGLIREALRNAANHTKELFGQRYKSLQIQSDHYGKGTLVPLYEAMTKHYTPARVRNAKAKIIEPFFKAWNKDLQLLYSNWSGYGVTSRKENQPNSEYLDKIKKSFPDYDGVCQQIAQTIEMRRLTLHDQYVSRWNEMADADHIPLTDEEYLNLFGETTGYTNRLHHDGLTITVDKTEYTYDSFDLAFREHRHVDWCVKFDRDDMSKVLVVNAESKNGRLVEEIGTIRFMLDEKYLQPMALHDRQEGDAKALAQVNQFNNQLEEVIIDRNVKHDRLIDQLFVQNPALNGTLSKMILTDSNGQHKDQRNSNRIKRGVERLENQQQSRVSEIPSNRDAYLDNKSNGLDEILKDFNL